MKIKQVKSVSMSNDDIEQVTFTDIIFKMVKVDDHYDILENDDYIETHYMLATRYLVEYAIDDDLVITGFGTHSGRKLWQLPLKIQDKIKQLAKVK